MSTLKKAVVVGDFVTGNGIRSLLNDRWVVLRTGGDLTLLKEDQNRFSDVVYLDGWMGNLDKEAALKWAQDLEDNYMVGMGYVLRHKS